MSEKALVVVLIIVLVGIGLALVREVRLYSSKTVSNGAAVAAENEKAVVVRAPEGNLRPRKSGHIVIPGKHGRGTREVVFAGANMRRGEVHVKFHGDNPRTTHCRRLSEVLS